MMNEKMQNEVYTQYEQQPVQEKKGMAIAGIIMCAITLLFTLGNSILGVIIANQIY